MPVTYTAITDYANRSPNRGQEQCADKSFRNANKTKKRHSRAEFSGGVVVCFRSRCAAVVTLVVVEVTVDYVTHVASCCAPSLGRSQHMFMWLTRTVHTNRRKQETNIDDLLL